MKYVVKQNFDEGLRDQNGIKIINRIGQSYDGPNAEELLKAGLIEGAASSDVASQPQVDEILNEAEKELFEEPSFKKKNKKGK